MKRILSVLIIAFLIALVSCELHDEVSVFVKHKAVVHLVYHYNNGQTETLDDVKSIRLFIYDREGELYRDTTISPEEFLQDTGAMQTYLSKGNYSFISWANVGDLTSVNPVQFSKTTLSIADNGADCLMFGRCNSPIVKGDSLRFDINLFKSVFKVNVKVFGLAEAPYPEDYYFGIMNRCALSMDNHPTGELKRFRPDLTYNAGVLFGSFYTPYFMAGDNFTVGVYCDNPDSQYTTLCETTIRKFTDYTDNLIGQDVEINVEININDAGITILITDWNGQIIQEAHLGA